MSDLRIFLERFQQVLVFGDGALDPHLGDVVGGSSAEFLAEKPHGGRADRQGGNQKGSDPPEGEFAPQTAAVDDIVGTNGHGCLIYGEEFEAAVLDHHCFI